MFMNWPLGLTSWYMTDLTDLSLNSRTVSDDLYSLTVLSSLVILHHDKITILHELEGTSATCGITSSL